ncbi:hypothetical protein OGATHE_003675 [Ogataea polymorpha]|uniref:Uncharacterized protein n=1 Tax=Ogataea polymorpha TaxID=460523 RepID=A0A9P8P421_9ASCO|nr:hypothetical protein OGATHE_003675 [Ogataea polymorpha]
MISSFPPASLGATPLDTGDSNTEPARTILSVNGSILKARYSVKSLTFFWTSWPAFLTTSCCLVSNLYTICTRRGTPSSCGNECTLINLGTELNFTSSQPMVVVGGMRLVLASSALYTYSDTFVRIEGSFFSANPLLTLTNVSMASFFHLRKFGLYFLPIDFLK